MRIERWDVHRDGTFTEWALQHKLERDHGAVTAQTCPSGSVMALPAEGQDRLLGLAFGLLKITIDEQSAILAVGDIVAIPSGRSSRLEALGASPVRWLYGRKAGSLTPADC